MRHVIITSILLFSVTRIGIADDMEDETNGALKTLIKLTHDENAEIRAMAFEALPVP